MASRFPLAAVETCAVAGASWSGSDGMSRNPLEPAHDPAVSTSAVGSVMATDPTSRPSGGGEADLGEDAVAAGVRGVDLDLVVGPPLEELGRHGEAGPAGCHGRVHHL